MSTLVSHRQGDLRLFTDQPAMEVVIAYDWPAAEEL